MFSPYTPLQQLDLLADFGTKSYVVGSTNSLLLQQKDRYSDILINVRNAICRPLNNVFLTRNVLLFSSMTLLSTLPHLLYGALYLCPRQTGVGLTSLRKLSMTPGMMHTPTYRKRTGIWDLRSSSGFSLKSTFLLYCPV